MKRRVPPFVPSVRPSPARFPRKTMFEALEQRILLSADAIGAVDAAGLLRIGLDDASHNLVVSRIGESADGGARVRVDLEANDHVFAAGHRIAVTILQSDHDFTIRPPAGKTMTLDTRASTISLPLTQPLP